MKDFENAANQLDEDLERVAAWCCQNSLLISPDKTKLLLLGAPKMLKKIAENFCVTLVGKKIFPVLSAKDFGVTLDSHLNYNEHVCKRVQQVYAR